VRTVDLRARQPCHHNLQGAAGDPPHRPCHADP